MFWDSGVEVTPALETYIKQHHYEIKPFDVLGAVGAIGTKGLASLLQNVEGVITTITRLNRLLEIVPQSQLPRADISFSVPPYIVHTLLREPSKEQACGSPTGSDIRCLGNRGPDIMTIPGSSAVAAAVITTLLPDLGANCESGSKCNEIEPADQPREFADFLDQDVSKPHLLVYVGQPSQYAAQPSQADRTKCNSDMEHFAALPHVLLLSLASIAEKMTLYGYYPTKISCGERYPTVSTLQDLMIVVRFKPGEVALSRNGSGGRSLERDLASSRRPGPNGE
jgi:hypothetical protein